MEIKELNRTAMQAAKNHWNGVAKPLHSLGALEQMVVRAAGIFETPKVVLDRRRLLIFCADNGIVSEGVTQTGSNVTTSVTCSMADGVSSVNRMAECFDVEVSVIDIGVADDIDHPGVISRKVAHGTGNFLHGLAMTREQAMEAVETGICLAGDAKRDGVSLLLTGEMGIGNTTTSAAIASVLLKEAPQRVVGRGAGLDDEGLRRKLNVVEQAIALHKPDRTDPVDILSKIGGYDIAGMAGAFLGAAIHGIPIIVDGVISAVAASLASLFDSRCTAYMMASHQTKEPAGALLLEQLGLSPVIDAGMCLGEGTGAVLLVPMLDAALRVYHTAHRFDEIALAQYKDMSPC